MPEVLSARALCTLDDVLAYIEVDPVDVDENDVLTRMINSASQVIHNVSGREFLPYTVITTPPEVRTFDITWRHEVSRTIAIGDVTTLTSVTVFNEAGTTLGTIAAGARVSLPRIREEWEPIRKLRFLDTADYIVATNVLQVAATWGFPAVPDDVRQACVETVAVWHGRDIEHISETYAAAGGGVLVGAAGGRELSRSLPRRAFDIADSYRLHTVL